MRRIDLSGTRFQDEAAGQDGRGASGPGPDAATLVARAQAEAAAAVAEAERAHARLREALEILPQGIVFLDAEGRYILWNERYAEFYRGSADLFEVGARLEDTLRLGVARGEYPAAVGREEQWIAERLDRMFHPRGQIEQQTADGRWILIDERRTADGGIIGLRVDITELKQREASFRLLFDNNPVPMFVVAAADGQILAVNDTAVRHYGFERARLLERCLDDLAEDDAHGAAQVGEGSCRHRRADGSVIDVTIFSRPMTFEGRPARLLAVVDVTERRRAEERAAYLAHHDALTGLPNRALLRMRMQEVLGRAAPGHMVAVLCMDLDDFKGVNDTLGHPIGDQLLQAVSRRIESVLTEKDTIARLGGDEFAILMPGIESAADVDAVARALIEVIGEPYMLDGYQVAVTASIGISLAPTDGDDVDLLFKNADMALYRAKADGRGTYRYFEAAMDTRLRERRALEVELRAALAARSLELHYQPLVRLETGDIVAFEALARWNHPKRGMIPPSDFVSIAEETGLIVQLGSFVLQEACREAAGWPPAVKVAVNLSPLQFRSGQLFATVQRALADAGLAPHRLELEITEALLLEKSEQVLATLHALRALGVRISMDDFGTGYSSLSYLRSFPFDKIKIDRSFVQELGSNHEAQAIIRAIIGLGESLGISVTAEGVESESALAMLRSAGCQEGQGYLFSRAQPPAAVADLLGQNGLGEAA